MAGGVVGVFDLVAPDGETLDVVRPVAAEDLARAPASAKVHRVHLDIDAPRLSTRFLGSVSIVQIA